MKVTGRHKHTTDRTSRTIYVYEKERWGDRSNVEKWGVKPRVRVEERELLILGSGRSGTKFCAKLFQQLGFDLRHECTGEYGSSTHFFHTDSDWYPMMPWVPGGCHVGERLSDYRFRHVLHIVRDPLDCIPSIQKVFTSMDWEFAEDCGIIPIQKMSRLERCMRYWVGVNKKIEQMGPEHTFKLEEFELSWPWIAEILRIKADWPSGIRPTNRGTGFRKSKRTNYSALRAENTEVAAEIQELSYRYGYATNRRRR